MSAISPRIRDLISTPTRKEIFKMIVSQKDGFTFLDLLNALEKKKVSASVALVKNILIALCYRGYLKGSALKETKTRGRSAIRYKKLQISK